MLQLSVGHDHQGCLFLRVFQKDLGELILRKCQQKDQVKHLSKVIHSGKKTY